MSNIGREGEDIAFQYLISKGYTILDRNYRSPYGEIDIISRKDNMIVFVEVKASRSFQYGLPEERVNNDKLKRIIRTARHYIELKNLYGLKYRFDLIAIIKSNKGHDLEHFHDIIGV